VLTNCSVIRNCESRKLPSFVFKKATTAYRLGNSELNNTGEHRHVKNSAVYVRIIGDASLSPSIV